MDGNKKEPGKSAQYRTPELDLDVIMPLPQLSLSNLDIASSAHPELVDEELLRSNKGIIPATEDDIALANNSGWLPPGSQATSIMWDLSAMQTWIIPAIPGKRPRKAIRLSQQVGRKEIENPVGQLRQLTKSSGIYALSTLTLPLVSLVMAPFLTHHLSQTDYGILAVINTAIGLASGITQLGLSSAFFRAYSYDYSSREDRHGVVATVTTLLVLISLPVAALIALTAPALAKLLLGQPSLGAYMSLAGGVVLLQNLTIPGLAWLRAEGRPLMYSLLSISNLVTTLLATILLVGILQWGVAGAIIGNGIGYACIVVCSLPVILVRAGVKIRLDIARGLLAFGLPLVANFVSYWVLQLSDRYLLSLFTSLAETARYTVVYTLGSAMSVVVTAPFNLAWPTALFAIAKRKDALQVFRQVFRWFSILLLFAAFSLSLVAIFLLDLLFPATYHSAAPIIPVVAVSITFYGVYYVFMAGANIKRKTWLAAVFTTSAALANVALNLVLIPHFGSMGAAASTLIAYILMAVLAYIVNQRIYPVPFEIGRFTLAFLIGVVLYVSGSLLAQMQGTVLGWGILLGALCLYSAVLALLAKLPLLRWLHRSKHHTVGKEALV